jgi:glycosyltransferase involved in cell wall biosynthesis
VKNPVVSVVMSVFNGEKFLREAIDSILGQTFRDFEFLIVNDGSRDGTQEILESYADPRIGLIRQENTGLARSLNRAIRAARGNYIARQDADDRSFPNRLEMEYEFLRANPDIAMIGTHASFIDKDGREFSVWRPPVIHEEIRRHLLQEGNSFCHGSVMARKTCLEEVGLYREAFEYTQDYDLWLRVSERYRVANLPEILYQFRRSSRTISRRKLSLQLEYHLLAQALASERERKGRDVLDGISKENLEEILVSRFQIARSRIRNFKGTAFLNYFAEAVRTGDRRDAIWMWFQSFRLSPRMWKIRFLLDQFLAVRGESNTSQ